MEADKKVKRPRIGDPVGVPAGTSEAGNYEKVNYPQTEQDENQSGESRTGYQPRYNQYGQSGYQQNRPYYSRNNYQQRGYGQQTEGSDSAQTDEQGENGYQRQYRPNNYQQGYNRPNNYGQQRPYNNNRMNGYGQQRPYNNNRQNNYGQPRPYNNNRMNGYGSQGYNRQNNYGEPRPYNNRMNGYGQPRPYNNRMNGYGQPRPYNNRYNNRALNNNPNRFIPVPRPAEYILEDVDPNKEIRLNKFLANSGLCSRREADERITDGLITVNGEIVCELGAKINPNDIVEYQGKVITPERKAYVLLNKPKDCVTTTDDPNGRTTVMDIVKRACRERIYPVGRLDRNTTGVLLLTNDGELASKLTHPKYVKKKIYQVWLDKEISEEDMQKIADGIELEDGEIHADEISFVNDMDKRQIGIAIHSGRNRIVRRIFEHLGYRVVKLDRVYFAGLTKKNLPRGKWRHLTQEEVNYLRMGSFE